MTDFAPEAHGSADPDPDETKPDLYGAMWERQEQRAPELIDEARKRRETVDRLFQELMRVPVGRRLGLVRQLRFRSLDFMDRLLEESHAGQLADPARACELARMAARLATLFEGDKAEVATVLLARAFSLAGNARRLELRPQAAEALFAKAARFLAGSTERAFYCRAVALLRWEQGRTDEAEALFQHATVLLACEGREREAATCLLLLGLMFHEEMGDEEALVLLVRGWSEMDREARPLVTLRGGLALAACLAQAEQKERARGVLREAWRFFAGVTDPQEMTRVYWREGRVLARLGEREEALHVLESVRLQLIAEPSPAEAALVSLDLAVELMESGRAGEIEALAEGLHTAFSTVAAMPLVAESLRAVAILARRGESGVQRSAENTAAGLRRMYRSYGLRIRPLPFA